MCLDMTAGEESTIARFKMCIQYLSVALPRHDCVCNLAVDFQDLMSLTGGPLSNVIHGEFMTTTVVPALWFHLWPLAAFHKAQFELAVSLYTTH